MKRAAWIPAHIVLLLSPCVRAQSEINASALMDRSYSIINDMPAPPEVIESEAVKLEEGDPDAGFTHLDAGQTRYCVGSPPQSRVRPLTADKKSAARI